MQWAEQCLLEIHIHLDGHVHTALFKMDNQKTYFIAQGTLINVVWQLTWEGDLGENEYTYICG